MTKIKPISKNLVMKHIQKVSHANIPMVQSPIYSNIKELSLAGTASLLTISTLFKDYNNTIENDNYFQFKIDPKTDRHYKPDVFQYAAGINLYIGNDVLVTAPTGTGKTAIAEYIMSKNLKDGGRTFYTTPLKALSNEKFRDFSQIYGEENVGLITGDAKVNTDAPIIIMTTEVYRNMAASNVFRSNPNENIGLPDNLKTVIFDELQYLGDIDRGGIWEQSIMFTPKRVQMLSLSATIGNNTKINSWMGKIKGQRAIATTPNNQYSPHNSNCKETILINVPPENRHVPLIFEPEKVVPEIKIPRGGSKAEKIRAKKEGARKSQSIYAKPKDESYKKITEKLYKEEKLPAIYFIFSKKECRHLLKYLSTEGKILTTEKEQKEIAEIIRKYINNNVYLGEGLNTDALLKGYAVHNAGLLPSQKTLIEELFQKKLVKVVLATETLSAGINMPAKTTVISSPRKPASTSDGGADRKRNLTPNEFHQMAGRAGRRGIDTIGYCIPLSCNQEQSKLYEELIASPSNKLESNLDLDFSFITNYMSEFIEENDLKYMLTKSLYVYNDNKGIDKDKLKKLVDDFKLKKGILIQKGYINPQGGITKKGALIRLLNGYEQIPIIDIIASKKLEGLNAIQVAGVIGGLANIEYKIKDDLPQKPFELSLQDDVEFREFALKISNEIQKYNKVVEELYPQRELELSSKVFEHLYTWAKLNEQSENSRKNWKYIYSGDLRYSIKDEGSLFKEISMTCDLLKQLINVAKEGSNISQEISDKQYYLNLEETLKKALALIKKEPIDTQY